MRAEKASKKSRLTKLRCFLVYALAPEGITPAQANLIFNDFIADPTLPLVLFHDHFIGELGGLAIFYAENTEQRSALFSANKLPGWKVDIHPLIYSYNPAAFDAQIAFTLRSYRVLDWERLRREHKSSEGNPSREAETGMEDHGDD